MSGAEFARPVRLDTLGGGARTIEIDAGADERAALARRFDLVALPRLTAYADLVRTDDVVRADGRVVADVVQACVATGADVPAAIDVPFALRFVPDVPAGEEIELAEGELDDIAYSGSAIDLGEAAAQTLALALDPFPRAPGADSALRAAGVLREDEAGPFSALRGLRGMLDG